MSEDEASAGGSELQFDRVAQAGGPPSPGGLAVQCVECRESIRTEYFTIRDQVVCERCKTTIERLGEPPPGAGPLVRAGLFGLGAGVAGAVVYYAVLAIAHLQIGIVAILIGYMVGSAVRRGARGRGGLRFQIVAAALTYFSVAMAYLPVVIQAVNTQRHAKTAALGTTNTGQSSNPRVTAGPSQPTATQRTLATSPTSPSRPPSMTGYLVAVLTLFGFTLSLPVLVVIGGLPMSLISALIIFVGLRQAWRLTAAPAIDVYGPYRVGATAGEARV